MKEVQYQGYARSMPFDPIRVSNANVEQIARQGAQTLKYMDMAAKQDLENRRAQTEALSKNAEFERQQLGRREDLRAANKRDFQASRTRNFEVQKQQLEAQALSERNFYSSLSDFSAKAAKLAGDMKEQKLEREWDEEYTNTYLHGIPTDQAMQQLEGEHQLQIQGEYYQTKLDIREAAGGDPYAIAQLRNLDPNRQHARDAATARMAAASWGDWINSQFSTNTTFTLSLPGEDGKPVELTPSQASTSPQKAAFLTALLPEYLKQNGLHGKSSRFLASALMDMRRTSDGILAETRKYEAKQANDEMVSKARDAAYDLSEDPFKAMQYYRTLVRSKDANGNTLGFAEARQVWLKDIYTATDGSGAFKFSEADIERILAQPFDGPDRTPIGDRYSAEIATLKQQRAKQLNDLYSEQKQTEQRQFGEWNDQTREWLNTKWSGDATELDALIEKAQKDGNEAGVKLLQMYSQDLSNTGRNDKFHEQLFAEKELMGVLTVEEVLRSDTSTQFKLNWKQRAQKAEQNAVPKEVREGAQDAVKAALARKLGEFDTSRIKHESYGRAVDGAMRDYMRDYRDFMLKPGATAGQADEYALSRFKARLDQKDGSYSVGRIENGAYKGNFFTKYTLKPQSQITFPLTHAREQIKADNNPAWSLENRPLLDKAVLQKISDRAKTGQQISLPDSARYLANMTNVSPLDVVNAQMKHFGIEQIPVQAMQRGIGSLDPEYQRLVSYQPNMTRIAIAGLGSGNLPAVPAKRIQGKVNSPSDILSTFLAAGGNPKEAALMTAIAMAESSGRQDAARSDTDVHGWFQVRYPVHVDKLRALGITSRGQLLDPMNNTKAALAIRKSQGLGAWEAYTNGAYKRFLPQAEAAMRSFGQSQWRQGPTMNFNVVQYLTGDRAYKHPKNNPQFYYAADHGGSNYHEHVGFRSRQDRDRAISVLKKHGVKIGSMNDGVHADGSLHYQDRAVDLPMPFNIAPGSREEQAYSRRVRQILGIPG